MEEEPADLPKVPQRKSLTGSGESNGTETKRSDAIVTLRDGAGDSCQRRAVAAFSYSPVHPDELRLQVDDVVEVLGEEEEGWWRGRLNDEVGLFPANYVKLLETSALANGKDQSDGENEVVEKSKAGIVESLSITNGMPELKDGTEAGDAPAFKNQIDVSTDGSSIDEIVATVKRSGGDGDGDATKGFAGPKADTKDDTVSTSHAPATTASVAEDRKNRHGSESRNAPDPSTKPSFVLKPSPALKPFTSDSTPVTETKAKTKDCARVIRHHDADNDDQLTLHIGNVVTVLSRDVEGSEDQWLGELNGKKGTFPSSCVVTMKSEEDEKLCSKPSFPVGVPPKLPPKPKPPVQSSPEQVKRTASEPPVDSKAPPKQTPAPETPPKPDAVPPTSPKKASSPKLGPKKQEKPPSEKAAPPPPGDGKKQRKPYSSIQERLSNILARGKSPAKNGMPASAPVDSDSDDFGGIARESVSLPPLTADRPRNPNRRPPSRYLNEMAVAQQAAMPPPVTTAVSPRLGQKVLPVPVPPKKPPKSPVAGVKKSGEASADGSKSDYVRREEFDQLVAAFEAFKRETSMQIKELEKRLAANGDQPQKL